MDAIPDAGKQLDVSLGELKAHKDELVIKRNRLQRVNSMLIPVAWISPLIGAGFAWTIYKQHFNFPLSILVFVYCLMPIVMVPSYRQRVRQIDSDIQDMDFQIDLLSFQENIREARAEKLLRISEFQLRRYYDLNISQNSWVFALGIFCIILGVAVIGTTLFLVIGVVKSMEAQIITATVGSIGAILSNFVAVIYLKMNTAATDNLKVFHSRLVETNQSLLGNLLASRIENDEKRWDTFSQLSVQLIQKGKE
jgi:hypothetical protein